MYFMQEIFVKTYVLCFQPQDINDYNKLGDCKFPFPLLEGTRQLASSLGMLDPDEVGKSGMPLTARCVSEFCLSKFKVFCFNHQFDV